MLRYLPIRKIHARQILDSRGNPTVEVEVTVGEGVIGINGYTCLLYTSRNVIKRRTFFTAQGQLYYNERNVCKTYL